MNTTLVYKLPNIHAGKFIALEYQYIFDWCIHMKVNERKFVILVLYVDDILLDTKCIVMLNEVKKFLSSHFEMKDMNETFYVIGIEIFYDRSQGLLGFSQKAYINKVL